MKKIILIVVAILMSCTTPQIEEEATLQVAEKGKPVSIFSVANCDDYQELTVDFASNFVVARLESEYVRARYTPYDRNRKKFGINITYLPCYRLWNDDTFYDFTDYVYRVNLINSSGEIVETYCFNSICYSTRLKPPKNIPDDTYTLDFIDFEYNRQITFVKPDTQYGG